MKEQAKKRGEREPLTGFYNGCPADHMDRRILIEHGYMVQCLKCMRVFDRDKSGKPEWNGKYKFLSSSGFGEPMPATPAEPGSLTYPAQLENAGPLLTGLQAMVQPSPIYTTSTSTTVAQPGPNAQIAAYMNEDLWPEGLVEDEGPFLAS